MSGNIAPAQPRLWPYILPTVLVLGTMTLYPIGYVVWMSLNHWTWGGDATFSLPLWLMVLCSVVMAVGTSIGGYRIIKAVGMDMVKLEKYQGFAADMAGAACLLLSSLTGIPVSTTHTKTTAIMGVGAARRLSSVNWGVVKEMGLTWALTFPGCGAIGFLMARLFMWLF